MTRSAGTLIRGNLAESWHHHPFVAIALAQATAIAGLWVTAGPKVRTVLSEHSDGFLVCNAVVVAAIWAARLAAGAIPAPFG